MRIHSVRSHLFHAFRESTTRSHPLVPLVNSFRFIDVSDGIENFLAMIDQHQKNFDGLLERYKKWQIPLAMVSHARGASVFDFWHYAADLPSLGIHASFGRPHELQSMSDQFASTENVPTLVLDMTSLQTILHLDLVSLIAKHCALIAPESLFRELRRLIHETKHDRADGRFGRDDKGRYVYDEITTEAKSQRLLLLERTLTWLELNARSLPAKAVIEFPPDDVQQWQKFLGQSSLDTLLLAHEHKAVAFIDDALLAEICRQQFNAPSATTQQLLHALNGSDYLEQNDYFNCLEKLVSAHYQSLMVTVEFFWWLLAKHSYQPNKIVRMAMRTLEGPACNETAAVSIIAGIIVHTVIQTGLYDEFENVLDWCLLTLITGRMGKKTITQLKIAISNLNCWEGKAGKAQLQLIGMAIDQWHRRVS